MILETIYSYELLEIDSYLEFICILFNKGSKIIAVLVL